MKKGKWVVFDLDGTLNRADLMTVEANRQAQREFNQPISEPEVIISAVGEKSDDYLNYIAPSLNKEQRDRYIARVNELQGYYRKLHGCSYKGSDQLLQKLRAGGYHIAICSNSTERYIIETVEDIGLRAYIDEIQPMEKVLPKEGTLALLLRRVEAEKAVMVGDRIFDKQAAAKNHIPFIGCLYGYAPSEVHDADRTVSCISEIPGAVKDLIG